MSISKTQRNRAMNVYNSTVDVFTIVHNKCAYFSSWKISENYTFHLSDPVPLLDTGCHFDMLCECEKTHILSKGYAGSRGGTYLEINLKIVN